MVDKPDLGSGAERRESSSLSTRTTLKGRLSRRSFFVPCRWRDASLREASSVLLGALPLMSFCGGSAPRSPAAFPPFRICCRKYPARPVGCCRLRRFAPLCRTPTGTGGSPAGSESSSWLFLNFVPKTGRKPEQMLQFDRFVPKKGRKREQMLQNEGFVPKKWHFSEQLWHSAPEKYYL